VYWEQLTRVLKILKTLIYASFLAHTKIISNLYFILSVLRRFYYAGRMPIHPFTYKVVMDKAYFLKSFLT
jgi:hypothetical protein